MRCVVETFVVIRRAGWDSPEEISALADRSVAACDTLRDVRWIRSYLFTEQDGAIGTVCIFEAEAAEAIYRHAALAEVPIDEVLPIADTVVLHADPVPDEA